MSVYEHVHTCVCPQSLEPLELELQVVMSHLAWVLESYLVLLRELQVFLTTEPSLQHPRIVFLIPQDLCSCGLTPMSTFCPNMNLLHHPSPQHGAMHEVICPVS